MAPQQGEFMDVEAPTANKRSSVLSRVAVVAAVVALVTVGMFFLTTVGTAKPSASVDAFKPAVAPGEDVRRSKNSAKFLGDDLAILDDCGCSGACSAKAGPDGLHRCSVDTLKCMGIDYKTPNKAADVKTSADCTTGGIANGKCTAVCEYIVGRYDCWNFPCLNGGFCTDGQNKYQCHCAFGYSGVNCEKNINECEFEGAKRVCHEQAYCRDKDGTYACKCNAGWQGDAYKEDKRLKTPYWVDRTAKNVIQGCIDIDDCSPQPCKNKAKCTNSIGIPDGFTCTCTKNRLDRFAWVGRRCETNVNECETGDQNDCDEKAVCVDQQGGSGSGLGFECKCKNHWTSLSPDAKDHKGHVNFFGKKTRGCYDYPDCKLEKPCANGGTCTEGPAGCEVETGIDPKTKKKVFKMVDCYVCTCVTGWSGKTCIRDENECGEGAVSSLRGKYPTQEDKCHDSALCTNTPGSYECACNAGWTGFGIGTNGCWDADDCEYSPCAHGGTCMDCGTLCMTCECVPGWRGTTCGTDWNECVMGIHICSNEATCVNTPGSYVCKCDPGYTGDGMGNAVVYLPNGKIRGCHDIDDCKYNNDHVLWSKAVAGRTTGPCVRGQCQTKDGPNAYLCSCDAGFTDTNCDMDINECALESKCHRFATCKNTEGSFTCTCNAGYAGNGLTSCLDISDCRGQCAHGFCTDLGVNDFRCNCEVGWEDKLCNRDIDECATYTHGCSTDALCTNVNGGTGPGARGYKCGCNMGFLGDGYKTTAAACKDEDDCATNPCIHGKCTDTGAKMYTCECQKGWTDFNCDFDINECYLKTHSCHLDARCVNVAGSYTCRCLAGYMGDGFKKGSGCKDLDDCDPDPCDLTHGKCKNHRGPKFECLCNDGWGCPVDGEIKTCGTQCNECTDPRSANRCSKGAGVSICTDTPGSYKCQCIAPKSANGAGYWGSDGTDCKSCTICGLGYEPDDTKPACKVQDRKCRNVDECTLAREKGGHNCNLHATCMDTDGSFTCECDQKGQVTRGRIGHGKTNEWWGSGVEKSCTRCTRCFPGYHEVEPCTSTSDRICRPNLATGMYMMESEADENRECITLDADKWYPTRVNYGNGGPDADKFCGLRLTEGTPPKKVDGKTKVKSMTNLAWKFTQLGANEFTKKGISDMYTIEMRSGKGFKCLFFGNKGKDLYPSLQNCNSYAAGSKPACPWDKPGQPNCGFGAGDGLDALVSNGQAIWRLTPVKLNEGKFILQNMSNQRQGLQKAKAGVPKKAIWECLVFEKNGAATNPSRYNWGNGDDFCGAGNWQGLGKDVALLNNKQAVFILTYLGGAE